MIRQQRRNSERQEVKTQRKETSVHNVKRKPSNSGTGINIKQKDESLVISNISNETLIAERDYYMLIKGAKTNDIRNRITRIESVLVARERIMSEMLKKKKEEWEEALKE